MSQIIDFRIPWMALGDDRTDPYPTSEWLLTNGLGGFASGTLTGLATRRYHGLLIAAFSEPAGRYLMLNHVGESLRLPDGTVAPFGAGRETEDSPQPDRLAAVSGTTEFRTDLGLPVWRYEIGPLVLERALVMPHGQNTTLLRYTLVKSKDHAPARLRLRPLVHFRPFGEAVGDPDDAGPYALTEAGDHFELRDKKGLPPLHLLFDGAESHFTAKPSEEELTYPLEKSRGYPDRGKLWAPGYFTVELKEGETVTLIASAEPAEKVRQLRPDDLTRQERERREGLLTQADPRARSGAAANLVLAADQFIIAPIMHDTDPRHLRGEQPCSVIAGYHWFTDWGRDTMISLEGLTLLTGRAQDARGILLTFAGAIRDGLVPNRFPEGEKEGVYYTADATLWYFHALERYRAATRDDGLVKDLLPKLRDIIAHHLAGTRFGIGVDPRDGLLRQGDPGYPLTWMDAWVTKDVSPTHEDWIVTPRRGKPVEINALWYNALRLMEDWLRREKDESGAREMAACAERAWHSFNARFWSDEKGYLYDVVDDPDGDDASLRPNQILALALRYPILDTRLWEPVFGTVRTYLLTPMGLRTLAPGSPDYQPSYFGDRRSRDAAYHQGTVWPWLLGPYVDAWLRVYPHERRVAHSYLNGVLRNLGDGCVGTINEIFDAEEPFTPRGCVAQAWSVAEVLRCLVMTA